MNLGWRMSSAKLSKGLVVLGLVMGAGFPGGFAAAETCPPVLKPDSKSYSALKVSSVSQKGQIAAKESAFSVAPHKGKVTVVRLFATWCPYCKRDLEAMNSKFSPLLKDDKLEVMLVTFMSRKESPESIEMFMKDGAKELGIEKSKFHWLYSRLNSQAVKDLESPKGEKMFPGMQGVPYGMVFDAQGRLRFQGHFTDGEEALAKHYDMIQSLASGKCS